MRRTKFIVVTGGVLSGLGKGILTASIGRVLRPQYHVVPVKCDGYLNVDPGTMNPVEHGEVFVLDDGGEVDLDFGHYERFLGVKTKFCWSVTSGKIFQKLVQRERKGDFLGKTVQVIPHVTGEIRETFKRIANKEKAGVLLIEIGGTVGDIENLWFLEAVRELQQEFPQDVFLMHLGLVPVLDEQGQQKTKPLQQSILFLRERGLFPHALVGRSKDHLTEKTKQKLKSSCNVNYMFSDPDECVYMLPFILAKEGIAQALKKTISLSVRDNLHSWRQPVRNLIHPQQSITIAICGKYTELADSYLSIQEALTHAGARYRTTVNVTWVDTTNGTHDLSHIDGIIIPGGFGGRGVEGKIALIKKVREQGIPFLGICYGMQLAVVEFARHICGLTGANTTEIEKTSYPVIDLLPEQRGIEEKGATMRLGGHPVLIKRGTKAYALMGSQVRRRFRHRYEVNPEYISLLESYGLVFSGRAPHQEIMQVMELPNHPFFMACQFHPELTSKLERPDPLFLGLIKSAIRRNHNVFKERPVRSAGEDVRLKTTHSAHL